MNTFVKAVAAAVLATAALGANAYADNLDAADHSPAQAFPGGKAPEASTYGYTYGKSFLTKANNANQTAADRALGARMDHDANAH